MTTNPYTSNTPEFRVHQLANTEPVPGNVQRDCKVSGGYHRYGDIPRYTTSDGALLTLGGHLECGYCHGLTHYSELDRGYREAACREAGRTFPGNLSESFAMYALESYGIDAIEARRMVHRTTCGYGTEAAFAGEFVVSLTYTGDDSECGSVFTVGANVRTAGAP